MVILVYSSQFTSSTRLWFERREIRFVLPTKGKETQKRNKISRKVQETGVYLLKKTWIGLKFNSDLGKRLKKKNIFSFFSYFQCTLVYSDS